MKLITSSHSFFSYLVLLILFISSQACYANDGRGGGDGDVIENNSPMITLIGASTITLEQGDVYTELGATAFDYNGRTVNVTISGGVDTSVAGSYVVTYTAIDSSGSSNFVIRTVLVFGSPFITSWKTDNPGASADNQIKIGTSGLGYNYLVDWGDGQTNSNVTGDITHTYEVAGIYTVKIGGDFPSIVFGQVGFDNEKILAIEQWGAIEWRSMNKAFFGCTNLISNAIDEPNLSRVRDMSSMFERASSFNHDISAWDVSSVTNMRNMFFRATSFNQSINAWNVSSVTTMANMFYQAYAFNQDISLWNVSSVTQMSSMFRDAIAFNQNIAAWDVSFVTGFVTMFFNARSFNQDIGVWNVSSATNMAHMFTNAIAFNKNIGAWDVSSVTIMSSMFQSARAFNQDIGGWNVSSVMYMPNMFLGATAFNQDISAWNVSSVTTMENMFTFSALSTLNYDALLVGWSARNLQSNVLFSAGVTQYSSASQNSRNVLTGTFNWTVTDGGVAASNGR